MEEKHQKSLEIMTQGRADPSIPSDLAAARREQWQHEVSYRAQLTGEKKTETQVEWVEMQEAEIERNEELIRALEAGMCIHLYIAIDDRPTEQ